MPAPPIPGEPLLAMLLAWPPMTPMAALTTAVPPWAEINNPSGSLPIGPTAAVPLPVMVFAWKLVTLIVPPPAVLLASNQTPLPGLLVTVFPVNDSTLNVPPAASTCMPVVPLLLAELFVKVALITVPLFAVSRR